MDSKIVPLELFDGQQIWIEVEEVPIDTKGPQHVGVLERVGDRVSREVIDTTIQNLSRIVFQSVSKLADDELTPKKVSLEFAVKFVGEAAIPTIAKGSGEANLGITIEWALKGKQKSQ